MSTFITKLDTVGAGPRLAVKDIIDVEGVPTTAGSRAVERTAAAAKADATCLAGARAAGARLVGKTNLHELTSACQPSAGRSFGDGGTAADHSPTDRDRIMVTEASRIRSSAPRGDAGLHFL